MFLKVFHIQITLHEPLFHASFEYGSEYLTEPVLTNYGLAYALKLATSRLYLHKKVTTPSYEEELAPLLEKGIYLTPSIPLSSHKVSFSTERWNAQGEGLSFKMAPGCIVDDPAILGGFQRARAMNKPQTGFIRYVTRGSVFESYAYVTSQEGYDLFQKIPLWIRLGKTHAKASCLVTELHGSVKNGKFHFKGAINPVDAMSSLKVEGYNMVYIRPVPILTDLKAEGRFFQTQENQIPLDMAWIF